MYQLNVNVLDYFLAIREAVKHFGESGGSIINISSILMPTCNFKSKRLHAVRVQAERTDVKRSYATGSGFRQKHLDRFPLRTGKEQGERCTDEYHRLLGCGPRPT
jgi:hypothetical protein